MAIKKTLFKIILISIFAAGLLAAVYFLFVKSNRESKTAEGIGISRASDSSRTEVNIQFNAKSKSINDSLNRGERLSDTAKKRILRLFENMYEEYDIYDAFDTVRVDGFSNYYYGNIIVCGGDADFQFGFVEIRNKKTDAVIIKMRSDRMNVYYDAGFSLNYNNENDYQTAITYKDCNFDDNKDFLLMNGTYSCYGTPTYKVYLNNDNNYKYSKDFTYLWQNFCGLDIDYKKKTISVWLKSGYDYNEDRVYKVVNNKLKVVFIKIQQYNYKDEKTYVTTKRLLKNGKWSRKRVIRDSG